MWECVSRVVISTKALQGSPYSRQCREESEERRILRVALRDVVGVPMLGIEAKEEFEVLKY
jgi:hypothetical protein